MRKTFFFPYVGKKNALFNNPSKKFPRGRPPAVRRSGEGNQVEKWVAGKEIKLVATLYTPG